jgi:hypothetical protein
MTIHKSNNLGHKVMLKSIFLTSLLALSQLSAKLTYQQEFTLSTFTSEEEIKRTVKEFMRAAAGDPDLSVIGVRYKTVTTLPPKGGSF